MVLVQAVLAGQSVDVMVIGHADFDGKGREFEIGVSRERAAGAESSLETFFSQAADSAALPTDQRKLEFYAQTPEIFKPFLSRYLAGAMFWLVVRSTDRKSLL